jgi:hypothetical protein
VTPQERGERRLVLASHELAQETLILGPGQGAGAEGASKSTQECPAISSHHL